MDILDITFEIMIYLEPWETIAMAETSKQLKLNFNHPRILNYLKSSLNTSYDISHFNYDEFTLFLKTTRLKKKLSVTSRYVSVPGKDNYKICDLNSGFYIREISKIYQFSLIEYDNDLLTLFLYPDGKFYHYKVGFGDFNVIKKYPSLDDIIYHTNNYVIYKSGLVKKLNSESLPIKNIIQIAGSFLLHKDGNVYLELINGQVYHPGMKKYFNYNKSWSFYLFNKIKYYKLNIKNVKQVTNIGYFLTENGKLHQYDWYTKNVKEVNLTIHNMRPLDIENFQDLKQIETVNGHRHDYILKNDEIVYKYNVDFSHIKQIETMMNDYVLLTNHGNVIFLYKNEYIKLNTAPASEIHIVDTTLIYLTDEIFAIVDLKTLSKNVSICKIYQ